MWNLSELFANKPLDAARCQKKTLIENELDQRPAQPPFPVDGAFTGQDPSAEQFSSVVLFWAQTAPLGQVQFPLPFTLQFPVQFPFTWQVLLSPAKGQEMPAEFRTIAIPARSRTSATIGNLFIIYPLLLSQPLPYETDRLRFFYLYFIVQPSQTSRLNY